ncbi:hypothetical protein ACFQZE_19575 [Paenibacillus sp. GCM10027627]|uniref:hypothetical protein n=1 Tax=unclassified Paenibacillus TaxID=185978 RepID=UPI00363EDF35
MDGANRAASQFLDKLWPLFLLLIAAAALQGCAKGDSDDGNGSLPDIPLLENVQSIAVYHRNGPIIMEQRDPEIIGQLLDGMRRAKPSSIGDPEFSGKLYELVLTGSEQTVSFSINDLEGTASTEASVKLYATLPGEERVAAWCVPTDWIQLLLNPNGREAMPVLKVTPDETNDSVTLVGNRDINEQSLKEAIEASLLMKPPYGKVADNYKLHFSDPRRVIIRFPDLPEGGIAEFMVDGTETADGKPFKLNSDDSSRLIVIRQGLPWSGLRWVDTSGITVREHGFDGATLIQPVEFKSEELFLYGRSHSVYRLNLLTGSASDIANKEWASGEEGYSSDSGVSNLYSYSADRNTLYAARGLKTIHLVKKDGSTKEIYKAERPIYGMAASPNGKFIAILLDSDSNLGPYADLVVLDENGGLLSEFKKAAYTSHSEGWHFIYPIAWTDSETIAVPLIGIEPIQRGKALYHYKEGLLASEKNAVLPEDAAAILKSAISGISEWDIIRVLPALGDSDARYYAVYVAGYGSWLIDRQENKAASIGSGALVEWTSEGEIVVWHSTEGKSADFAGLD